MTVRGRAALEQADCVIHDYLVGPRILSLVPAGAAVHDVGKRGHASSRTQNEINALLLACARQHQRIVRLKGGDPFMFGRGGEEAQILAEAGIAYEVVPGVTSGIAVPAYAGIPVTHRANSASVAFVAGHLQEGDSNGPDWAAFAKVETLVLYMGMQHLAANCAALITHGRSPDTPAAAIQWGTLPQQRCVTGTLVTLPGLAKAAGLGAPAITVIGDVVRYREHIAWFDNRPLWGRRVLVTRAAGQAGRLAMALEDLGAEAVHAPLQRFIPADSATLDTAIERAATCGWLALSSTNAVDVLFARLRERQLDVRALGSVRIAAVGPGTAEALRRYGVEADLIPPTSDAPALAASLIVTAGNKRSVLLAQAAEARAELADQLRAAAWRVHVIVTYRAESLPVDLAQLGRIDAITVASAATAERLLSAFGLQTLATLRRNGCRIVAIGPRTADACAALHLRADAIASQVSAEGIAQAVVRALAGSEVKHGS